MGIRFRFSGSTFRVKQHLTVPTARDSDDYKADCIIILVTMLTCMQYKRDLRGCRLVLLRIIIELLIRTVRIKTFITNVTRLCHTKKDVRNEHVKHSPR